MRRALIALLLLLTLGLGALWGAQRYALGRLERAGIRWEQLEREGLAWRFSGVTRGGLRVAQVLWSADTPRALTLRGLDIDLLDPALLDRGDGGGGSGGGSLPEGLELNFEGITLRAGEHLLAQDMSGTLLDGQGSLRSERASLTLPGEGGARAALQISVDSPISELQGELTLTAQLSDPPTAHLSAPALILSHPQLAEAPLPLPPLTVDLRRDGDGALGEARLGDLSLQLELRCPSLSPPDCTLSLELPDSPAQQVLAPLLPLAPELRRAEVQGQLGGGLTLAWPSRAWTVSPRLGSLRVSGATPNLGALRQGVIQYKVRATDGTMPLRALGEGAPDWTPLGAVSSYLPAAIVAAEDSAFWNHGGYDPSAILEALAEGQAEGQLTRGGSTLTQQLAKNLFLTPERTLARKLRELLIAAEMDRSLGKERIMALYLNAVEWGPDLWGVRAAADRYFLKQPQSLLPNEAAFLAALLPDPRGGYRRWYLANQVPPRLERILNKMAENGVLTPEEAARWLAEPLRFVPPPQTP